MPRTSTTTLGPTGDAIVLHIAGPGPDAALLRHEAVVLERVRGPGVVALLELREAPDGGAALATAYVPGGTLTHVVRTEGEAGALRALAEVARTLARLHDLGVVHGRCTADHVLGDAGGVTLCGFAGATIAPERTLPDTAPDRQAFAALVESTLTSGDERARAAHALVQALVGGDGAPGPDLRAVADRLAALAGEVPTAGRQRQVRPSRPATARRRPGDGPWRPSPRRWTAGLVALAAVAAVATLAMAGTVTGGGDGEVAAPAPAEGGVAGAGDEGPAPAPPVAAPGPDLGGPDVATVVRDGDGDRYAVGGPGDLVVVGDWDCDGIDTPAVVRPADGTIWAFPGWGADGSVPAAELLGYAAAPRHATVVPTGDGCDRLAVTSTGGQEVVLGR